jgi:hypothetical protein
VTGKFIGYFDLLEACGRGGCPVCACLDQQSRRAVAAFLYEHVTDPATRRRLRASWGFCNWHTWELLAAESVATGAAILYEDLLRVCRERVDRLHGGMPKSVPRRPRWFRMGRGRARRVRPRLVEDYRARARCPVCASLRVAEAHYIEAVVEFADDREFRRAYEESTGLCLPHLIAATEQTPGPARLATLLDTTLAKWEDLRRDLERFVSKNEYRNTEAVSEREADSYRRAFEVLAGRPHIFGNDLHRGRPPISEVDDRADARRRRDELTD